MCPQERHRTGRLTTWAEAEDEGAPSTDALGSARSSLDVRRSAGVRRSGEAEGRVTFVPNGVPAIAQVCGSHSRHSHTCRLLCLRYP